MSDLVERLWASDAASALTNEAARRIEELEDRLGEAYQMFGQIAADAEIFDTQASIALLDLLSKD